MAGRGKFVAAEVQDIRGGDQSRPLVAVYERMPADYGLAQRGGFIVNGREMFRAERGAVRAFQRGS